MSKSSLFDIAWRELEATGGCDARGGAQYRRLRQIFMSEFFSKELVKQWIQLEANALPDDHKKSLTERWRERCLADDMKNGMFPNAKPEWMHEYAIIGDLVRECGDCQQLRASMDKLVELERDPDHETAGSIPGLDDLRVKCLKCDSRGWLLSDKGKALLKMLQESLPFTVKEKEIPF